MTSNGTPRDGVDNQNDITNPSFQTDTNTNPPHPPPNDIPPPPGNENTTAGGNPPANSSILGHLKKIKVALTNDELLNRVQEENTQSVKELDDPFSVDNLVPTPHGGWPTIHTHASTIVLDNVCKAQSKMYLNEPSQVAVALLMYENSWDSDDSSGIAAKIIEAIQGYFKVTTVTVSPANQERPTKGHNNPLCTYFINNISSDVYNTLITQECVALSKIQFIVQPLRYQGPCAFMGNVMGLINIQNLSIKRKDQLLDDFRKPLYSTPNTYTALLDIALNFYDPAHPQPKPQPLKL